VSGATDLSREKAEALRATPGFDAAMRRAAAGLIALRQRNRFTSWLLSDRARAMLHHVLMSLDAEGAEEDPRAGLTPGRFKAVCVERGFCSPGRAGAILAFLRAGGMLHAGVSPTDGRVVRLHPTDRLREAGRERLRVQLDAFAPILPCLGEAAARLGCTAYERAAYRRLGAWLSGGGRLLGGVPELAPFAKRDAGILILYALLVDAAPGDDGGAHAQLSIAGLSRRLRTSRPHVLRVIRQAEQAHLLTRTGDGNDVHLAPRLVSALGTLYADLMLLIAHCAEAALAEEPDCTCCTGPARLPQHESYPSWTFKHR